MPRYRARTTNRGVPGYLLETASKVVEEGITIRKVAEKFRIPVPSLARYVKKRRELADEVPGLLPSVGYKGCNAVLTNDQELSLVSYIRTAAALYYGLPPREVGIHSKPTIGRDQVRHNDK